MRRCEISSGKSSSILRIAPTSISSVLLNIIFRAEHYPDDEAVEREVTSWFRQQPKEFYAAGFQGLVKRWDKCLNVQGDYEYVEK
jgi:hypothetical protein